jgi:hypothetical protein
MQVYLQRSHILLAVRIVAGQDKNVMLATAAALGEWEAHTKVGSRFAH